MPGQESIASRSSGNRGFYPYAFNVLQDKTYYDQSHDSVFFFFFSRKYSKCANAKEAHHTLQNNWKLISETSTTVVHTGICLSSYKALKETGFSARYD